MHDNLRGFHFTTPPTVAVSFTIYAFTRGKRQSRAFNETLSTRCHVNEQTKSNKSGAVTQFLTLNECRGP